MVNGQARHFADTHASGVHEQSQIRRRYELPAEPPATPRPRMDLGTVFRRAVDAREMRSLPLDHRAAFVLSQIDGTTPLRAVADITGFVPDELVALVERLLDLKAIAI